MDVAESPAEDFLKSRRRDVCSPIREIADESLLTAALVDRLQRVGDVVAPSLDMDNRRAVSITQIPSYQPMGVVLTVGKQYEGIQVIIPVKGDYALFKAFVYGKHICDGFTALPSNQIKIVQYDFLERGVDGPKSSVKTCVENLANSLNSLNAMVEVHRVSLAQEIAAAIKTRKEQILAKQEKNKNADPWG